MIAEHSAYLSRALHDPAVPPRIPRRAVSVGGFGPMMKRREARAAVRHWWQRVLRKFGE
jgi:hypothetical protein